MSNFLFVAILCTVPALGLSLLVPCYGEGCLNVTVYLGPRWGSRAIAVPRTHNESQPWVRLDPRPVDHDENIPPPQHKPIPPGGGIKVDYDDDESSKTTQIPYPTTTQRRSWESYRTTTARRPTTRMPSWEIWGRTTGNPLQWDIVDFINSTSGVRVMVDKYGRGLLDLTWRGGKSYNGEDLKQILTSLPESSRRLLTKLVVEGNKIRSFSKMTFPVELEYGLQELSLAKNPFALNYIGSTTRFELSRLATLRTLNLSHCELYGYDMPYFPYLEVLDLSYNNLAILSYSLHRLENLQQLFLRGNRIAYIHDQPLVSLKRLWILDLGLNDLRDIYEEPFKNFNSLVTIKLDNNRLKTLPKLWDNGRTKVVYLANNTLQCSCDFVQWVSQQNIQIRDESKVRCLYPDNSTRTLPMIGLREFPDIEDELCAPDTWGTRLSAELSTWYHSNPDIVSFVSQLVGVALVAVVAVVVVMLLRRRRTVAGRAEQEGIAYNILDEQQVSTVCGRHADV